MKFVFPAQADVSDDLKRLADHCSRLAAGRAMADWHAFRPQDVPWMLGHLFVVDVVDGGRDFFFRLSGVQMRDVYGVELENVHLSAIQNRDMREALLNNYRGIVESGVPLFKRVVLRWKQGFDVPVQRLLVPFAGPDGKVHTILGGIHCEVPEDLLVLYRDDAPMQFILAE